MDHVTLHATSVVKDFRGLLSVFIFWEQILVPQILTKEGGGCKGSTNLQQQ